MDEHRLIGLSLIIVLGVGAQWLAWRLQLPSILLLLLTGLIAGPVTNLLHPDDILGGLLFPLVSLAVALILFEGGLTLRLAELPHVGGALWRLLTIGALVTFLIGAAAARLVLGFEWGLAALVGAIFVVTGPTVIGPLLAHVRPSGRVGSILKWEGIVIDPIGVMLTVLIFEAIVAGETLNAPAFIIEGVLKTLLIGSAVGAASAGLLFLVLIRYWVPDFLQNAVALALVAGCFALSNHLQAESGLLAVIVMGVALANQKSIAVKHIIEFKENLRVLLLSGLFIILAARLRWGDLARISYSSFVFLLILIALARPLSVLASTIGLGLSWRERGFLAWMAPRGVVAAAVSSVFALRLQQANYPGAELMVPLTVVVIVGTVAIYGLTASAVARRLEIARPHPRGVLIAGAHSWARDVARALQAEGLPVLLVDTSYENVGAAHHEGLPVIYASVLSESLLEEVELGESGRLLAMTSNDEVNSLACLHFTEAFGRAEVYQLVPKAGSHNLLDAVAQHHRGRLMFGPDITYRYLTDRFAAGATLQSTRIPVEIDSHNLQTDSARIGKDAARIGKDATPSATDEIPLFIITETGNLQVFTSDRALVPRPGQVLITLKGTTPS